MGVTQSTTATFTFAMHSLLAIISPIKRLSNQPLSRAAAPSPVQQQSGLSRF